MATDTIPAYRVRCAGLLFALEGNLASAIGFEYALWLATEAPEAFMELAQAMRREYGPDHGPWKPAMTPQLLAAMDRAEDGVR